MAILIFGLYFLMFQSSFTLFLVAIYIVLYTLLPGFVVTYGIVKALLLLFTWSFILSIFLSYVACKIFRREKNGVWVGFLSAFSPINWWR